MMQRLCVCFVPLTLRLFAVWYILRFSDAVRDYTVVGGYNTRMYVMCSGEQ